MAVSKVILNGDTLMDITGDTVDADNLLQSYTAHKADGTQVTGTASGGGSSERYVVPQLKQDLIYNSFICEGYDFAPIKTVGTVGETMRIETRSADYVLDTLTRVDTGASIPYTEVSPILGGVRAYAFTMPDADVQFYLLYDD